MIPAPILMGQSHLFIEKWSGFKVIEWIAGGFQEHVVIGFQIEDYGDRPGRVGLPVPIVVCDVNEEHMGLVDPFGRVYTEGKLYFTVEAYKEAVREAIRRTE